MSYEIGTSFLIRSCRIACRFVWLGESAIASWGKTDGVDATAGSQPFGTRVLRNLCHEIGLYEKQTSCYFQV